MSELHGKTIRRDNVQRSVRSDEYFAWCSQCKMYLNKNAARLDRAGLYLHSRCGYRVELHVPAAYP